MILRCFDNGMTPVSILGTLVKAIVAFEINGKSGQVKILNLIFPDTAVSSALTSRGALTAVWNRIAKPGGVALGLRLVTRDATGWAWKLKAASPNYSRISILFYLIMYTQLTMLSSGWPGNGGNTRILRRWKWSELRFQKHTCMTWVWFTFGYVVLEHQYRNQRLLHFAIQSKLSVYAHNCCINTYNKTRRDTLQCIFQKVLNDSKHVWIHTTPNLFKHVIQPLNRFAFRSVQLCHAVVSRALYIRKRTYSLHVFLLLQLPLQACSASSA